MNIKYLSMFCLLALSVGGCAKHMVKNDSNSAPPMAKAEQSSSKAAQPQTSAPQQTKVAKADPAPAPANAKKQPGKDPAAKPAQAPTPKETATASKLLPLPPKEVVATIKRLTTLSRVRYLSRTAQYDYYVGGRVEAKYDIKKSQLVVTNAPAESKNTITCEYSKDGKMISDKRVNQCNKLFNEMTMYLDR